MAANKEFKDLPRSKIIALKADGSNVRAWEESMLSCLFGVGMTCLTWADFAMLVSEQETHMAGVEVQVERVITARRVKFMANHRFLAAQKVVRVKAESANAQAGTPSLEKVEVKEVENRRSGRLAQRGEAGSEGVEAKEVEGAKTEKAEQESADVSVDVEIEGERQWREIENEMKANGARMAARNACTPHLSDRLMTQRSAAFLDPISALPLTSTYDTERVCYVRTIDGVTKRYAIETDEFARLRMTLDAMIVASIKNIPAHVCTDVLNGNVYARHQCVVLFFDDVSKNTQVMDVSVRMNGFNMKPNESFHSFTTRFLTLQHEMGRYGLLIDPAVMFGRLQHAINESTSEDAKSTLWALTTMGYDSPTTAATLLEKMKAPMRMKEAARARDASKSVRVHQEQVNAAWQRGGKGGGGKGGGGKGGGGKGGGGKGGRGDKATERRPKSACLNYALGSCERQDCHFDHKNLDAKGIAELKTQMAEKRAAQKCKKASDKQQVRVVVPSKTAAELFAELQLRGFDSSAIKEMSALAGN
jgi:uncharacterized membrane protein YgcG